MNPASLALRGLIRAYQLLLSPVLPASCRFHPSCSAYAFDAVGRHGALRGSWLAVKRLARCHPWNDGGFDPVPEPTPNTERGHASSRHADRKS
ncbi:MAG: membrane protein insertion efficiency factor YidD [Magnetospirillum sp.]|nr:membrane protein insertion efficiency factor YidD [Magnetospirillum sp.]